MSTPLILLIISFVVMMGMIYFKLVEIRTGKSFLFFGGKSDHILGKKITSAKGFVKQWDWKTISLLYHFVLEKIEGFFLKIFQRILNKFDKPVSMVKGQGNLTEEKPSTSFFLKNIEEHKLSLEDTPREIQTPKVIPKRKRVKKQIPILPNDKEILPE